MTVAKVLEVARRELGTAESPPNSNRQKYGRAYGWDGVAWCAIFTWYVLTQAGCGALIPKSASTVQMRDWYMKRGQWHTTNPRPGDLVFFKFAGNNNPVNHVGIVEAVEAAGTVISIEGNTAGTTAGDQRNGGMVARKRRLSNIVGYARPAYAPAQQEDELSQQQVDQIRRDIGWARDQIMTHLGKRPDMSPLPPAQLAGVEVARRVDVGWARDQMLGEFATVKHEQEEQRKDLEELRVLVEAIAEKLGIPVDTPGAQ